MSKILKIKNWFWAHKVINGFSLLAIIAGGYFGYMALAGNGGQDVRYVTQAAEKGMIASSVSGTGQVAASSQVDVKAKVSGEVTALNVKKGDSVKEGDLLAVLDARDASKTVRDAQNSLETARLDLEKLKLTQEKEFKQAQEDEKDGKDDLEKAYEDAMSEVSDVFLDLPTIISNLNTILSSDEIADSESSVADNDNNTSALINAVSSSDDDDRVAVKGLINRAEKDYNLAREVYESGFTEYKNTSRYAVEEEVKTLLDETAGIVKKMAEAAKSEANLLDFWIDYRQTRNRPVFSKVSSYWTNLGTYTSQLNSALSGLTAAQQKIKDAKTAIEDAKTDLTEMTRDNPLAIAAAERGILEKEQKLADLKAGTDELTICAKRLNVRQKQDALTAALEDLADCSVRAPFGGVIAEVSVSKGDLSSAATVIASLIGEKQIAEIALNEVDAAKVKIGQKAALTFDAIDELEISGQVVEIDIVGAVSQGVVSYNAKIAFDVQDERIKSGMSVSASIIVDSR